MKNVIITQKPINLNNDIHTKELQGETLHFDQRRAIQVINNAEIKKVLITLI